MNKNRWRDREVPTIGQVSKIYGASVKTLRHYEKVGPLRPEKTDEANGYRYYEDSWISTMLLARRLKRYGLSPTDIQDLLDIKDAGSPLGQLRKQKFRLKQQMNYLSVTAREIGVRLKEFERTDDIMSYQSNYGIQVRGIEEQALVTSKQNMSVEEFGSYYRKLYEKIAREHLTANGITMAIYHGRESDPAYNDIELAVGITERDKADCIMPKRFCATIAHEGVYSGLPNAYSAIISWIDTSGYRPDGMSYEIYVRGHLHNLPSEEWETEIFPPVKR